eukprot:3134848-Prymnesium_polylepis.1
MPSDCSDSRASRPCRREWSQGWQARLWLPGPTLVPSHTTGCDGSSTGRALSALRRSQPRVCAASDLQRGSNPQRGVRRRAPRPAAAPWDCGDTTSQAHCESETHPGTDASGAATPPDPPLHPPESSQRPRAEEQNASQAHMQRRLTVDVANVQLDRGLVLGLDEAVGRRAAQNQGAAEPISRRRAQGPAAFSGCRHAGGRRGCCCCAGTRTTCAGCTGRRSCPPSCACPQRRPTWLRRRGAVEHGDSRRRALDENVLISKEKSPTASETAGELIFGGRVRMGWGARRGS